MAEQKKRMYGTYEGGQYMPSDYQPRLSGIAAGQAEYLNQRGMPTAAQYSNDINAMLSDPNSAMMQAINRMRGIKPSQPSAIGSENPDIGETDINPSVVSAATGMRSGTRSASGVTPQGNAVQNDALTVAMLAGRDALLSPIAIDMATRGLQRRVLGSAGSAVAGGFRPGATGARMTAGRAIGGLGKRVPLLTAVSSAMEGADRSREFGGDSFGGQFGKALEGAGNSLSMGGLDAVLAALPDFLGGQGANESDEEYYARTGRTADLYGTRSYGETLGNFLFPQSAPPMKQTYQRPTPYGF